MINFLPKPKEQREQRSLDQYLDGRAHATMGWSDTGGIF
jgi:hypothetical protein